MDDAGDVLQSYEFDPHGNLMPGSGASSGTFAPKTFHGSLSVNDDRNDSGLYLMGHRHWDSTLSRFISRDPIGFKGGLNLFNGAGTTPVDRVDPTGLLPQKGEYPRVDEIFAEILRRADNEKCRKALEILATFCTDPQPVRTDFPKNNVLEGIFALSNVDLRLDPNGDPVKGYWNQPYSGVPGFPQGSTIQLAGDLGAVGSPIRDEVLEKTFHELAHNSGVGHYDPNKPNSKVFIEGEAFLIHVARVCMGTSGKWASTGYVGTKMYWDKTYEKGGKLDNAIKACPLP